MSRNGSNIEDYIINVYILEHLERALDLIEKRMASKSSCPNLIEIEDNFGVGCYQEETHLLTEMISYYKDEQKMSEKEDEVKKFKKNLTVY